MRFQTGSDHETYLTSSAPEHVERWRESEARAPELTEDQRRRLRGYNRGLHDWLKQKYLNQGQTFIQIRIT